MKVEYVLAAVVDDEVVYMRGSQLPEVIEQCIDDAREAVAKHTEEA